MLARLPAGTTIFVDANIFLYHVLNVSSVCSDFFERARRRTVQAYTSPIVLSEVLHQTMLAELGEQHPVRPSGALRLLRRRPELIETLRKTPEIMRQIGHWRIRVLPLRWREIVLAAELTQRYHLLTNDALIVATMRAHRLTHLASNDRDFARVPGLTRWRP